MVTLGTNVWEVTGSCGDCDKLERSPVPSKGGSGHSAPAHCCHAEIQTDVARSWSFKKKCWKSGFLKFEISPFKNVNIRYPLKKCRPNKKHPQVLSSHRPAASPWDNLCKLETDTSSSGHFTANFLESCDYDTNLWWPWHVRYLLELCKARVTKPYVVAPHLQPPVQSQPTLPRAELESWQCPCLEPCVEGQRAKKGSWGGVGTWSLVLWENHSHVTRKRNDSGKADHAVDCDEMGFDSWRQDYGH